MSKKSYQFVFSETDERIDAFLDAQPYKNMAFKVMIYDYIRRYGYTDIVLALLYNQRESINTSTPQPNEEPIQKRKRGRPRKVVSEVKVEDDFEPFEEEKIPDTIQEVIKENENNHVPVKQVQVETNPIVDRKQEEFVDESTVDDKDSLEKDIYDTLNDEMSGALDPYDLFNNA